MREIYTEVNGGVRYALEDCKIVIMVDFSICTWQPNKVAVTFVAGR
jgi:hypothetical protein